MTESERITALEEKSKSIELRVTKVESVVDNINALAITVERIAVVLETQTEELKGMNARLSKIENEPRDTMKHIQRQIITALITGIVTAIFFSV